jgi:peptidoglycan/LPS O-acetylase OafA/YrhL
LSAIEAKVRTGMSTGRAVPGKDVERFYSLDVLRGLAALSVVLWHWQDFFYVGTQLPSTFAIGSQPLFGLLAPFYRAGYLAVDLFFSLSGFIFYALYAARVSRREVSAKEFFVLRFSRLYPLHLITLLTVAIGQMAFRHLTHTDFAIGGNDLYHFVLNLFFASSWGLERSFSFNGPIWSVSVEVLLYAIFFTLGRLRQVGLISTISICVVGAGLSKVYPPIAHGLLSFFLGGLVFLAYKRTLRTIPRASTVAFLGLILLIWLVPLVVSSLPAMESDRRVPLIASIYMRILAFPVTIYLLAVCETIRGTLGKSLAVIGDISYSTYLWHFPLQLALVLAATSMGIGPRVFQSASMLVAFYVLLVSISYISYRNIEVPAQRLIRHAWLGRNRSPLVAVRS